ncbi:hypothetical protein [Enterobacter cloacae]|uniref:hypothetical protein n=1 Tax=Enterobacter cloacae TaxID=550 RepID=UPI002B1FBECA|nr:hypothetical protein [Enterobacter cloacae]MEA5217007.1 hypothetical protein [Enterobacter cloacae]
MSALPVPLYSGLAKAGLVGGAVLQARPRRVCAAGNAAPLHGQGDHLLAKNGPLFIAHGGEALSNNLTENTRMTRVSKTVFLTDSPQPFQYFTISQFA